MKVIVSRTDAIGDVILTLSLLGFLKSKLSEIEIFFLASQYTQPILESCKFVDKFINYSEIKELDKIEASERLKNYEADVILHVFPNSKVAKLAKMAKIPVRVGTRNRFFHWTTCNKLIKLSRKNSDLHEAQLNLKFAEYFGLSSDLSIDELPEFYGFECKEKLLPEFAKLLDSNRKNIIFHPKSNLSAREWGIDNFNKLASLMPEANIFITGTEKERKAIEDEFDFSLTNTTNLIGKFSLSQLVAFISNCDALVAASTGPLHIAAFTGITAVGLFPPIRPMHAGRWGALGKKAKSFSLEKECNKCRKSLDCTCLKDISADEVANFLKGI